MKIVALAGGVGGAKLADGLAQLLPVEELTVIVNTGDDFEHLGLAISPDLDTVCYMLAGLANPDTGWGRSAETFHALENITALGGVDWFALGDKDLGTHIERTRRLKEGQPLSRITRDFCLAWGIRHSVLPMSDQPVRTIISTKDAGDLAFQEYFVHRRCVPQVKSFRFDGVESALPSPGIIEAIESSDGIIFCPSNPWVSLDPIISVSGIRPAILKKKVIAVSPIIGGKTVKGPAAKMNRELGLEASALAVADHYSSLLTGFVIDSIDQALENKFSIPVLVTNTLMNNMSDRRRLAQDVLNLFQSLSVSR